MAIAGVLAACVVAAAAPSAWAATVWSGQSTSDPNWSTGDNWIGGTQPTSGTLSFPNLAGCTSPHFCFTSFYDHAGASFDGITIDDGAPYGITGGAITLGSGGISADATTSAPGNIAEIDLPATLGANQTWSVDGGDQFQGLAFSGHLLPTANTLDIALSRGGVLAMAQDQEVGNVAITGAGAGNSGLDAPSNGIVSLDAGQLNGSDGNTVTLTDAALGAANVSVGQLTSLGGDIQVGNGFPTPGILTATGRVTLDATSAMEFTVGAGATAGTDYGQLDAQANDVTLAGALQLLLRIGCAPLHVGDVDTLVTTTGTISGTFANAPDGAVVETPQDACGRSRLRIDYPSAHAVTATVLDNTPHSTSGPTISGILADGETLTEQHATWTSNGGSSPSSYHYAWSRCDGGGGNCVPVGGDGPTYTLQSADAGHTMRVAETAVNAVGASPPATSQATFAIGALTPYNQVAPEISGDPTVGHVLHSSTGTWSGTVPMSFSYQWWRCHGLWSCAAVTTGPDYLLTAADVGASIHVVVTASNVARPPSASRDSSAVGPVKATDAEIMSQLRGELVPKGKAASIRRILRAGAAVMEQAALESGVERVKWYWRAARHRVVLVASGRLAFGSEGRAKLKLKLTSAGRRMLLHAKSVALVSDAAFTPTLGSSVGVTRNFMLKR